MPVNFSHDAVVSFLVSNYGMSSQEAMQKADRIVDLHRRNISPEDAKMYLKSGGWDTNLAEVYRAFLDYKPTTEKGKTMSEQNNAIPVDIVQEMLSELIIQFSEASGFRGMNEGEGFNNYKSELLSYIRALASDVGSRDQGSTGETLQAVIDDKWTDELRTKVGEIVDLLAQRP